MSSVLLFHTSWEGVINPSIYSISREEGASKQREHSFGLREDGRRSWMSDLDCKEGDLDLGSCLTSGKGWGVNCDVKDTAGVICNGKQQLHSVGRRHLFAETVHSEQFYYYNNRRLCRNCLFRAVSLL